MAVRVDLLSESCGNAERYQDDVTVHPSLKASATGYRGGTAVAYCVDRLNGKQYQFYDVYGIDHAITTGANCTAQGMCVYKNVEGTLKAHGVHAVVYALVTSESDKNER